MSTTDESSTTTRNGVHNSVNAHPYAIPLTTDERELFDLLRQVTVETGLGTTLRVAGGWVRDKLLATPEFEKSATDGCGDKKSQRLTAKFQKPTQASMGRQGTKVVMEDSHQPVDIDIALDDMVGREFADHLNQYLSRQGKKTVSVGVVLKNPEKSKHLETATMKVGSFWIDFVNLRAEEYTKESRIPDLMRIGTPAEDAFRRDLTINALFYNINDQQVEDFTGRGFDDLQRSMISTPLPPLTTLLDDPLRVLRSVRFAARLRFHMDDNLVKAARDEQVRTALAQKVSRERVGGEVDLMLRSPDPVGAMRLLIELDLVQTVFPIERVLPEPYQGEAYIYVNGLELQSMAHDHLCDCKDNPPLWCQYSRTTHGFRESTLLQDEESRRLLWYASFLKPLYDYANCIDEARPKPGRSKKRNRSVLTKMLVNELKRPARDAEIIEKIISASDDFTQLLSNGCDQTSVDILLNDVRVVQEQNGELVCSMKGRTVKSETEQDPLWQRSMQMRLLTSKVLDRVGPYWRAALVLSIAQQLVILGCGISYPIEGDMIYEDMEERRKGIVGTYDAFAAAIQNLGLIGIWGRKPLMNGGEIKVILPQLPHGPVFKEVTSELADWMTTHPDGEKEALTRHLQQLFDEYC